MKKILIILIIIDAILFGLTKFDVKTLKLPFKNKFPKISHVQTNSSKNVPRNTSQNNKNNQTPKRASYNTPASGSQFSGSGQVTKILSDDNSGSRHQRFIIKLPSGQTILIAHNIDIAPRVPSLNIGDTIYFNGIYEQNSKGGVVHWTHRDPKGRHTAGYLQKHGQTYQ